MLKVPSLLKDKKGLFILLFLMVIIITIPHVALAWANPFANLIEKGVNSVINGFVLGTFYVLIGTVIAFSSIAKIILEAVIALVTIGSSYTKSDAVNIGWPIVRDLANMMIVLGFVVIGIATSLRIKEYEAKKLLTKLIVVALLVNFSLLICGVFIDASNIVMNSFFGNVKDISSWFPAITDLAKLLFKITSSPIDFVPKLLGLIIFNFIAGFVYLLYAILFLCRLLTLWMLVILSPLAFVCYVFPATKKIWDMWWNSFFQWCLIVLPAGLFYYIGSLMISKSSSASSITLSDIDWKDFVTNAFSTILVPGMFLVIGFFVSLQFAPAGASAIMNFANKNKGKILGAGAGVASKGMKAGGAKMSQWGASLQSRGGTIGKGVGGFMKGAGKTAETFGGGGAMWQKTRSAFGRGFESVGGQPTGAQATADQKRVDAAAKLASTAYNSGRPEEKARVRNTALHGSGIDKHAAVQTVANEGDLHEVFKDTTGKADWAAASRAIHEARLAGADPNLKKNAEKRHYELAGEDTARVDSLARAQSITSAQAKEKIIMEQLKSNLPNMTASEYGRINSAHVGGAVNYDFIKENFTHRMVDQMQLSKDPALIAGMKTHLGRLQNDINNSTDRGEATRLQKLYNAINRLPGGGGGGGGAPRPGPGGGGGGGGAPRPGPGGGGGSGGAPRPGPGGGPRPSPGGGPRPSPGGGPRPSPGGGSGGGGGAPGAGGPRPSAGSGPRPGAGGPRPSAGSGPRPGAGGPRGPQQPPKFGKFHSNINETYATLGVDPRATAKEIKSAYRKAANATHPDKGGSDDAFKKVKEAYEKINKARGF